MPSPAPMNPPPTTVPEDVPLFDVSTHDLYALAHGLVESDVDHEFCHRLFKELVKWHRKVGLGGVGWDGGGSWKLFCFSCSFGGSVASKDRLGDPRLGISVEIRAMKRKRPYSFTHPFTCSFP